MLNRHNAQGIADVTLKGLTLTQGGSTREGEDHFRTKELTAPWNNTVGPTSRYLTHYLQSTRPLNHTDGLYGYRSTQFH